MICPKCGANNTDGATFCGSCGAQLPAQQPQSAPSTSEEGNYQKSYDYSHQQATVPPGGPLNGGMVQPKNYMTEAIVVTVVSFLCCCSPISIILGIIAIVKGNNVNPQFAAGQLDVAMQNSESAKKLTIWAAIIAVVWYIIGMVIYFAFLGALINNEGGLDNILNNM